MEKFCHNVKITKNRTFFAIRGGAVFGEAAAAYFSRFHFPAPSGGLVELFAARARFSLSHIFAAISANRPGFDALAGETS